MSTMLNAHIEWKGVNHASKDTLNQLLISISSNVKESKNKDKFKDKSKEKEKDKSKDKEIETIKE